MVSIPSSPQPNVAFLHYATQPLDLFSDVVSIPGSPQPNGSFLCYLPISFHSSPLLKSICCTRSLVLAGPDQHIPIVGYMVCKKVGEILPISAPAVAHVTPPGSGCRNMIERRWLIFISHIFHYEIFPLLFEILQLFDLVNEVSTFLFCIALYYTTKVTIVYLMILTQV